MKLISLNRKSQLRESNSARLLYFLMLGLCVKYSYVVY